MLKLIARGFWWGDKDELVLCLRNRFIKIQFRDFISMVEGGREKLFITAREKKDSHK